MKECDFNFKNYKRFGAVLVVSGPSGAGKSTICKELLEGNNLHFSISCTTRKPRPGEIHGKHYYFITIEEFEKRIENNEFIEHANVHGNYYGTLKKEVLDLIKKGNNVLLDVDVQGAMKIKETSLDDEILKKCTEYIFIAPPSFAELEKRLRGRGTEPEEVILKRLHNARKELEFCWKYDYLVVNEIVEKALNEMNAILISLNKKTKRIVID